MKIILKNKVKKLGNVGDIVEVKDGYGKNMLIPTGMALFYTEKNYEVFKNKKAEIERQNHENRVIAEELRAKIISKEIILIENAGDDGKLYGSISSVKVANFINDLLRTNIVKKANVILKTPIKNVGKFTVTLELYPEVSFEKELIIARSKEEAEKIKKGEFEFKKNEKKEPEIVQNSDSFQAETAGIELKMKKVPSIKNKAENSDAI